MTAPSVWRRHAVACCCSRSRRFFAVPLLALLNFSTKDPLTQDRSLAAWQALVPRTPPMTAAITTSLLLALLTVVGMVVLLVPTMIWVRLRVPRATRLVEFLCLLPLTIPALVIVVGMNNVYAWVDYLLGDSPLTLAFVYVVLVLPYSYRAIDASLSAARRDDPGRGGPLAGRRLVHRDHPGDPAEHLARRPRRRLHRGRPGARRVHHRLAARTTTRCRS